MRTGNLLIYSATEGNFCIWLRALPRCHSHRTPQRRKPIRRARCGSSLPLPQERQWMCTVDCTASGFRNALVSHSSWKTGRGPPALSALPRPYAHAPTATRSSSSRFRSRSPQACMRNYPTIHSRQHAYRFVLQSELRNGREPIASSDVDCRVHSLRKSKSRESQYGIARHRLDRSSRWRALQIDDRY